MPWGKTHLLIARLRAPALSRFFARFPSTPLAVAAVKSALNTTRALRRAAPGREIFPHRPRRVLCPRCVRFAGDIVSAGWRCVGLWLAAA